MKYINERTGVVLDINGTLSGNGWKLLEEKKPEPKKEKEPKKK